MSSSLGTEPQDSSADATGPSEDWRTLFSAEAVSRELANVKATIVKTEAEIDKAALLIEALEKFEDASTLTPQQSVRLAYLRKEKTELRQKDFDLRQDLKELRQKEARLDVRLSAKDHQTLAKPSKNVCNTVGKQLSEMTAKWCRRMGTPFELCV
jgi:hypothetical protein